MDLQEEYKEETGFSVGTIKDIGTTYYSDDYTKWLEAKINYTRCCESDSEQLHTEVFKLANKLAINGYGNEAVKMHGICNGM